MLAGAAEPVRRFFAHALPGGAESAAPAARVTMSGRVRAGAWLPFTAVQDVDARSFTWSARVGIGPLTVLRVVDRYADAEASMTFRALGRIPVATARDADTVRSAAGRTALEAVLLCPGGVLPGHGVSWEALDDDHLVATFDLPPERPEVHVRIDGHGAVRSVWAQRWGATGRGEHGYLPCGADVLEERSFGDVVVPCRFTVAWWYGTPRAAPFFEADVHSVAPTG